MKIYTSYFANLKEIKNQNLIPIGIAISPPRFYSGISYKKIAPRYEIIKWAENIYIPEFKKILSKLNVNEVINDLSKLSNGKDIALLCYEKPGEFCHRRLVAQWIKENTGIEVDELQKKEKPKRQTTLLL